MTTPRKLTADDLWTFKEMGTIALSPDGRRVAFVTHSLNKEKNERHSTIYLLQLDEQGHAVGGLARDERARGGAWGRVSVS